MPMLGDLDGSFDQQPATKPLQQTTLKTPSLRERPSNESISTDLCDGPVDETASLYISNNISNSEPSEPPFSTSRHDLIQRLKRSQSPPWQRDGKLDALFNALPTGIPTVQGTSRSHGGLLPPFELEQNDAERMDIDEEPKSNAEVGREIERPRSALHAGDFTEEAPRSNDFPNAFHEDLQRIERSAKSPPLDSSPTTPWYRPLSAPRTDSYYGQKSPSIDIPQSTNLDGRPTRSRAPSLQSYSTSFILKPPTSPLVHQSNNDDLDFSPIDISSSPAKFNRRHTLPHGFQSTRQLPTSLTLVQAARQPPSLQRENIPPFQAHQPRRSYGGGSSFPSSQSPQTPSFLRSRRPSFTSDASPISASMVGSYEESILRGRMSTTPSKPLDFTAQIGALGKGEYKPKMPAHVTVEFPAVYYSWQSTSGGSAFDEPAPYVGIIDIEHKLPTPPPKEKRRRRKEKRLLDDEDALGEVSNRQRESRREEKRKRRSPSPLFNAPWGGCYQIPQAGQLQILIKNPNKTAVKLFLVPYDLEGMQPGTKTFVRQRCYSEGPIIEKALTSQPPLESTLESKLFQDSKSKRTLRYLIQLNICCTSKGKFYLYKHIHVVFANRVPDNKEKLQSENIWPEPRYSPYKPNVSSDNVIASSEARIEADEMLRRRSYGGTKVEALDDPAMILLGGVSHSRPEALSAGLKSFAPVLPISFGHRREQAVAGIRNTGGGSNEDVQPNLTLRTQIRDGFDTYTKLNRGDIGYGGVYGRPGTPEPGDGLLARRLKGLDGEISPTNSSL